MKKSVFQRHSKSVDKRILLNSGILVDYQTKNEVFCACLLYLLCAGKTLFQVEISNYFKICGVVCRSSYFQFFTFLKICWCVVIHPSEVQLIQGNAHSIKGVSEQFIEDIDDILEKYSNNPVVIRFLGEFVSK